MAERDFEARDIDHIVATHRLAAERRKAGLPVWDRTIDIKAILHRDQSNDSDEHAIAVGKEIAALIRTKVPAAWLDIGGVEYDSTLDEIVEGLEDISGFDGDPAVDDLNGRLRELYDWADLKRVWLGL